MARKKQDLTNIFAPTGAPEATDDPVKSIGVGLRDSEGKRLTEMAQELGVNRHALLLWIVRDFIHRWEKEGFRPPTERTTRLKQ